MRGLIGGFGAGILTAVLGFIILSLVVPLPLEVVPPPGMPGSGPRAKAPEIAELPKDAQFDSAGSERVPQLAAPVGAPVEAGAVPPVPMPENASPEPALSGMTPPERPEAGQGMDLAQPAPDVPQVALAEPVEAEAPVPVPPPGEIETPALVPAEGESAAPVVVLPEMPISGSSETLAPAARAPESVSPDTAPTDTPAPKAAAVEPSAVAVEAPPAAGAPSVEVPAAEASAAVVSGAGSNTRNPDAMGPEGAGPEAEASAEVGTDVAPMPTTPPTEVPAGAAPLPPVLTPDAAPETGPEIVLLPDGTAVEPPVLLPRVFRPDGSTTFRSAGTQGGGLSDVPGVRVNRLPTIGSPSPETQGNDAGSGGEGLSLPQAGADADRPALRRYAAEFTGAEGLARYAVVILDEGEAAGGLDRTTIKTLGLPVTIAIDPERPDAAEAAADYRAAGLEVAILARPLPLGATASDLEIAVEDWHRKLPEAIAIVEPAQPLIQNNRSLAQQLVKILAREGLGLVTQDQGLNAAAQIAASDGLPEAEVWRVLDTGRDDAPVIERTLSRAAFEAQREGQVAVMLSSWPQSIAGLMSWAGVEEGKVALAPISALMAEGQF